MVTIDSFLVQGAGTGLATHLGKRFSPILSSLDALVFLSLGADHPNIVDAVKRNNVQCPVFVSETYGILGYDIENNQQIELMEKGRGSEYGFVGGSGGRGVLAVGYAGGGAFVASSSSMDDFPIETATSFMVVADQSESFAKAKSTVPVVHYGGITKKAYRLRQQQELEEIPYFWVADTSGNPTGITTFKGTAGDASEELLSKLPNEYQATGQMGLFPCFTRGVNQYGAENVESDAIGNIYNNNKDNDESSPPLRIYGMFAHGELGPTTFSDFASEAGNCIECDQHGMTTILAIHTTKKAMN